MHSYMELETLKDIWQQQSSRDPDIAGREIFRMAASGSKTPVALMKRNLKMELLMVLALYAFAIVYYLVATTYAWIAVFLGALLILYFFYYSRKKSILDQMTGYSYSIRNHLETQIRLLKHYMKWYGWVAAICTPMIFILVLFAWYGDNPLAWYQPGNRMFYLLFAGMGVAFSVISFLVNKWYVYQLYGKHIATLKKMLEELIDV